MDDLVDQVDHVEDDVLRLMFLTCHPALTPESRAALTLRLVGGLTTEEIARGFQVKDTAVGQRISRAKKTLAEAGATLEMPVGDERTARLDDVMAVIYLVFNEGYAATAGYVVDAHRPLPRGAAALPDARRAGAGRRRGARPPGPAGAPGLTLPCPHDRRPASRSCSRTRTAPAGTTCSSAAGWPRCRAPRAGSARRGLHDPGGHRRLSRPRPARRRHRLDPHRRPLRPAVVGRRQPRRRGQPGRRPRPRLRPRRRARRPGRGRRRAARVPRTPWHAVRGDLLSRAGRPSEASHEFRTAASLTRNEAERSLLLRRAGKGGRRREEEEGGYEMVGEWRSAEFAGGLANRHVAGREGGAS